MSTSRRNFLLSTGVLAADLGAAQRTSAANAAPRVPSREALKLLLEGNARFVAGTPQCSPLTARRAEIANGQSPFAAVLGCADSRVPVETIFDREPGDIFVVRLAGNFADASGIGSLEYGVSVLKASVLMVLGHTSCGAVQAAVDYVEHGKRLPGHMQLLADAIAPAVKRVRSEGGDVVAHSVAANVRRTVESLSATSAIITDAGRAKHLMIMGAVYDLHAGKVSLI